MRLLNLRAMFHDFNEGKVVSLGTLGEKVTESNNNDLVNEEQHKNENISSNESDHA